MQPIIILLVLTKSKTNELPLENTHTHGKKMQEAMKHLDSISDNADAILQNGQNETIRNVGKKKKKGFWECIILHQPTGLK